MADFLRAGLFQLCMRPALRRLTTQSVSGPPLVPDPSQNCLHRLPRLIAWMQATGEFEQEWKRLDHWRRYWSDRPDSAVEAQIALALFDWFAREADRALGRYTAGVDHFLHHAYARRFWREDQIFCGRVSVEYHLGMVAAEVMNDGLRADFQARPLKVVLVPSCMRGARSRSCKAKIRGLDITCTGCDPDCNVNRISRRMRREGIEVYIVPHASSFSRWLERWQNDSGVGVGAVACMMNILSGGYEMRARGIASQCVPLDYPGCARHWMDRDIPTRVNEERLVQIVTSAT